MVTWRFGMTFILILLSVVFLFSLSMAEWGAYNSPNATFYLLPTRGWELLVGVFIAFYLKNKSNQSSHFLNQILSLIGLSLIVYSVIAFNKDTPTPSVYLLIPTLGTGLLILSANKRTFVHSLLSSRPLVGIGLVSYSAYLWHQPLLAALAFASPFESNHACKIFLIALTLIFAVFSYRFIEAPFREKQKVSKQSVFLLSFIGFAVLTSAGVFLSDKNEHNIRLSKKFDKHGYIFDNSKLLSSSWSILGKRLDAFFPTYSVSDNEIDNELWFNLDDLRSKVLIVGNSHSKDFYNVLHFSDQAKAKLQLARYGTQIKDISFKFFNSPNYKNADVIMLVSAMTESDIVSMDGIPV